MSGEAPCAVNIRTGGYFYIENSDVNGSIYIDSSIVATVEIDDYTRNNMNGEIIDLAEQ